MNAQCEAWNDVDSSGVKNCHWYHKTTIETTTVFNVPSAPCLLCCGQKISKVGDDKLTNETCWLGFGWRPDPFARRSELIFISGQYPPQSLHVQVRLEGVFLSGERGSIGGSTLTFRFSQRSRCIGWDPIMIITHLMDVWCFVFHDWYCNDCDPSHANWPWMILMFNDCETTRIDHCLMILFMFVLYTCFDA